jgi:hypothetical protein
LDPIYLRSGGIAQVRGGAIVPAVADEFGALSTVGKMQRAAMEGRLFSICSQAAVATTAALATTWTGLGICNPAGSNRVAIVHQFSYGLAVAGPDDGAIGLMESDDTGFAAALTIRNCNYGAANALTTGLYADDGATIATPILTRMVGALGIGATNLVNATGPFVYNIDGGIILQPDRSLMTYTTTATTAALLFSFVWEEIVL